MPKRINKTYNFLDLFSGIGGFHKSLSNVAKNKNLNINLLSAVDIDPETRVIYKDSYNHTPLIDVRDINAIKNRVGDKKVDIIFAGFPCQPFSKAGKREGFADVNKGNLFFALYEIISFYKPKYVLLENVHNLKNHDSGRTWSHIKKMLEIYYDVPSLPIEISPHQLGHPELRKRVYIPCILKDVNSNGSVMQVDHFRLDEKHEFNDLHHSEFPNSHTNITDEKIMYLNAWKKLLDHVKYEAPKPMWSDFWNGKKENVNNYPDWKYNIIMKNKIFYNRHKVFINNWLKSNKVNTWKPSFRKMEWNAGSYQYWNTICQFRPSGIRLKRPNYFPTFVAINQTPVLMWNKKLLSPYDILNIQGFDNLNTENTSEKSLYRMTGNTVNVHTTSFVIDKLLEIGGD